MLLELLQQAPLAFALLAVVLMMSLALHEFGHAYAASLFGDNTARYLGRVTINPLKHLDVLGTALLLLVGFGWAKPVPIRPDQLMPYRLGLLVVSLAGVAINLAIAFAAIVTLALLGLRLEDGQQLVAPPGSIARDLLASDFGAGILQALWLAVRINLILLVFNLLPIPPLDGSKALQAFAPRSLQTFFWQLERFGLLLVVGVIVLFREQVLWLIDTISFALMGLVL